MPAWSLPAALGAGAVALLIWNFSLGLRLSDLPETSKGFRVLSGLGAFLFLPALVIGLLAPTAPGARVLGPLAWLWPLVTASIALQALWAFVISRASRASTLLIAVFNLLVAWVAATRWIVSVGGALPVWALAPGVAVSSLATAGLGDVVFPWGAALFMPALASAAPARARITRVARALLASGCALVVVCTALALPRAFDTLSSTRALDVGSSDASARGELAIGVRVFGTLAGPPSSATARHDMALADSLGVTALHVELDPPAVTAGVLDSVARSIEPRRDSLLLVVTLTLGGRITPGEGATARARQALIERIVRRLRPDVLLPAERVTTGPGAPGADGWRAYYERAAATARRVDRDVTVALATDASSPADSALADWVMAGGSRVDAVALATHDGAAEPRAFVAALNAVARWASLARVMPDVWIVGVPTAPIVMGEVVQQQLVRHALAWSAARPWVRGVIAGDASDITAAAGLRTASGRARRALADVAAALRVQRDLTPATTIPDTAAIASDSAVRSVRSPTTTLPPPPR